tara:strand:+ start:1312 stop:1524 length:213 start_codon:yes stop_codon:yes gene_type:complete
MISITRQEEVINATMSKKDVMLILPTGGGKSLSYQLSGVLSEGITLVVCICGIIAIVLNEDDILCETCRD